MSGEYKFNTCVYRSSTSEYKRIKCCCDTWYEGSGYSCIERGIFPLKPSICEFCGIYGKKEESQNNN